MEMAFRIEPPTKSISDVLKQYTPAVVIVDRWYKQKGVPLAYSLSFLPIGQVGEEKIDLNQPSQLQEYLERQCYDGKNCFRRICSHSTAGNFTALTYTLSDDNSFPAGAGEYLRCRRKDTCLKQTLYPIRTVSD